MKAFVSQVNDTYFVRICDHFDTRSVMIDGERYDNFTDGQIKKKPLKIQMIRQESYISHYGNDTKTEDGALLVEEFKAKEAELKEKYDEKTGFWESLEDEFEYRKFCEKYPPVVLYRENLVDIEIVYLNYKGVADHPYIHPLRLCGLQVDFKNDELLYRYDPQPVKIAQDIAQSLGFAQVEDNSFAKNTEGKKWSVPSHSGLEFIKINDNYATLGNNKPKFYGIEYGTWKECEKRYQEHVGIITEWFSKALRDINAVGVSFDKAMVLKELQNIASQLDRVDVKVKSEVQPRHIRGQIQELIYKI